MGQADGDSIQLLLVDDDPDVAAVTEMHLERQNDAFEIVVEHGAEAALEHLDEGVDCVVSDYEMPRKDGLEFLRDVREYDPALPFVLFTGRGSEEIASEAISAGVTDYLQKGSGIEQYAVLANRVENAVARRRSEAVAAETESRYRSLVESSPHAIVVHDDETVLYANDRVADILDADGPESIAGTDPLASVHPEDRDEVRDRIATVVGDRDPVDWTDFRLQSVDDDNDGVRWVEARAVPVQYEQRRASQVVLRDVTDRRRRERRLETLSQATRRLLTTEDVQAVADVAIDVLADVFEEPIGAVWRYDAADGSLVPLAVTERALELPGVADVSELPPLTADSLEVSVFEAGEPRVVSDYADRPDTVTDNIGTTFLFPLDEHGMLGVASERERSFDATERELVGILARAVIAAFDRLELDRDGD